LEKTYGGKGELYEKNDHNGLGRKTATAEEKDLHDTWAKRITNPKKEKINRMLMMLGKGR